MDNSYYKQQLEYLAEMTEKSAEKQRSFFQSILIVSVTLLGILVSLHDSTTESRPLRYLYALSVALLALGILSSAIVLHDWSKILERARKKLSDEAISALRENRELKPIPVERKKISLICEKTVYISLVTSLLLLTAYAILSLFS
ncbi:MAG: hypothetical protein QM237_10775 [Bacteroidota bacterium]|jgi:hypothetical protein|nr:hypothetical protein [Bacteroidota bacterium]HHU96859.1 hypothetical protein [Petrimonas sp.]